jgi:lysophospholipase L1-like esterase
MNSQRWKLVALVFSSVALAVVLGELALRAAVGLGYFPTLKSPNPPLDTRALPGHYYVHPYSSYAMKPGYRDERQSINSLGLRGREIPLQKPAGEYRVVALGGSTTYGIYNDDRHTYPLAMETALRRDLGTDRVQVINAGLVGATSADNLHRMLTEILPLEPDLLVIYFGFNDIVPRVFNDFSMDYYHFRKTDPYVRNWWSQFVSYRLALRALFPVAFSANANLVNYIWKFENLPESDADKIANFNRTSAAAFERNVEQIIRLAQANGVKVVLSTFAIDADRPNWMYYVPAELWPRGVADNNAATRRLAERFQLPLIDFYSYGIANKTLFHDSIHPTDAGNALQGELFAQTVGPLVAADLGLAWTPSSALPPD